MAVPTSGAQPSSSPFTFSRGPASTVTFAFGAPVAPASSISTISVPVNQNPRATTGISDSIAFTLGPKLITSSEIDPWSGTLRFLNSEVRDSARKRHDEYYISDGNVILVAETTLFCLHQSILAKHSPVFRHFFLSHVKKSSEEKPWIALEGVKEVDFSRFLWMLYPPALGVNEAQTADQWISIVEQSHKWQTKSLTTFAANQLDRLTMDPVAKMALWERCGLQGSKRVLKAYVSVCERAEPFSLKEAQQLGLETFVKVVQVRERTRLCQSCDSKGEETALNHEQIVLEVFNLKVLDSES